MNLCVWHSVKDNTVNVELKSLVTKTGFRKTVLQKGMKESVGIDISVP